jgi:hypothetical protein
MDTNGTDNVKADLLTVDSNEVPPCPNCLSEVRQVRSMMDPMTGRAVRMFECDDCGQRGWDD